MSETIETVKVKSGDSYKVINKCDMSKDDVIFKEGSAKKSEPKSKKKTAKK